MTEYLIGTGGWAYFQVPGLRPLEAYARAFNFVEVNSTFYEIPALQIVKSWRRRVPPDFQFSVRCHKDVTHACQLEPTKEAYNIFEVMIDVCETLNSRFLVLETPPTLDLSNEKIKSVGNFLGSFNQKGFRIVWEIRRKESKPIPSGLLALMHDHNIIHCADLSKEEPAIDSDTVYTRVFGKGEHNIYQFTDEELLGVDNKIGIRKPGTAAVSFHNVRMHKDAARFKIYKQTKSFPPVTGAKGQQSLKEVLLEDARFPAAKQELISDQGWKVVDLTENRRVHAHTLLEKLPDKQFRSVEEVLANLPQI